MPFDSFRLWQTLHCDINLRYCSYSIFTVSFSPVVSACEPAFPADGRGRSHGPWGPGGRQWGLSPGERGEGNLYRPQRKCPHPAEVGTGWRLRWRVPWRHREGCHSHSCQLEGKNYSNMSWGGKDAEGGGCVWGFFGCVIWLVGGRTPVGFWHIRLY